MRIRDLIFGILFILIGVTLKTYDYFSNTEFVIRGTLIDVTYIIIFIGLIFVILFPFIRKRKWHVNYFIKFILYNTEALSRILFPFSEIFWLRFTVLLFLSILFSLTFTKLKLKKVLSIILFSYFMILSIFFLIGGSTKRPETDLIRSDLEENRNYAVRICLSCIGIE